MNYETIVRRLVPRLRHRQPAGRAIYTPASRINLWKRCETDLYLLHFWIRA